MQKIDFPAGTTSKFISSSNATYYYYYYFIVLPQNISVNANFVEQ